MVDCPVNYRCTYKDAYFNSLFNNSPEAIAIVDSEFRILNINDRFESVFQYNLAEIENEDITKLLCEQTKYDDSYNFRKSVKNGEFVSEEVKRKRKDGNVLDVLLMGFPLIIDDEIVGAYCIYTDISEFMKQKNIIQMLTQRDFLTGLSNRSTFLKKLRNEIQKKSNNRYEDDKLAVLILSVNEFKEINDALGHIVGDLVLKEFSIRLAASVKDKNIIARFINNEFTIMISPLKDTKDIEILIDTIIENLYHPFCIDNKNLHITTNIGVVVYPDDGDDDTTLMRKAEIAMCESKKISDNNFMKFDNSYDEEIQEYFWMKNDLLKSIQNNELFLDYQPIYNIDKNKLVGVEALIRWNHKNKGIIQP